MIAEALSCYIKNDRRPTEPDAPKSIRFRRSPRLDEGIGSFLTAARRVGNPGKAERNFAPNRRAVPPARRGFCFSEPRRAPS